MRDTAWLSLVEMRFARTPKLDRHIEGPSRDECARLSGRTPQPLRTAFAGEVMKAGTALSVVRDGRANLPPDARARVLGGVDDVPVSKLVNKLADALHRPEIGAARRVFSNRYMEVAVKKDDKF
ncbi:hypothetical protein WS72_30860 [Burkholderia savannae]|uniref:Uncharacterized protein n=1 Tax=Burkholderia savannae TaxID=1637837 RepID=A0ABR5T7E9_9BURK|nr:hypothetical protein [Burkholderia savannae]KWZ39157.1 hypothetical protein WS72_30860 [Burkholderia savannae]KWZ48838.1 hypothetical protein WS73_10370 [Burkholderia savannae]